MLLFYRAFLRVVVSTANLQLRDYNRKTQVDYNTLHPHNTYTILTLLHFQGMWYQDFERKQSWIKSTCDFEETLVDYFTRLGLAKKTIEELRKYDYSSAKVMLISSVPGYHSGTSPSPLLVD